MKALSVKGITRVNENDPVQELNLKGTVTVFDFENENFLAKMYELIETDIVEAIDLPSLGLTMWIDEEGKLKNDVLPNLDGTFLYMKEYGVEDVIMGHITFTSIETDEDGYVLGLSDEKLEVIKTLITKMQTRRPDIAFATDVLNDEPKGR